MGIYAKMSRILYGIIAVVASVMLADSLTCNSCSVGLLGYCVNSAEVACTNSTEVCFTTSATFPSISGFKGFSSQGCMTTTGCNATTNATKLSLTAALGAAVLASVWGTMMY